MFSMPTMMSFMDVRFNTTMSAASCDTLATWSLFWSLRILSRLFMHLSVTKMCLKYGELETLASRIEICSEM